MFIQSIKNYNEDQECYTTLYVFIIPLIIVPCNFSWTAFLTA